jgi:hypothetical protein
VIVELLRGLPPRDRARPEDVLNALAVMRVLWCVQWLAIAALYVAPNGRLLEHLPAVLWYPISLAVAFDRPPLPAYHDVLVLVMALSTLALAAGLATRLAGILCFVSSSILMSMAMSWGKIHHDTQILLLALFVMLFSDWGARWSVDGWWAQRRGKPAAAAGDPRYAEWPLWMCTFTFTLLYMSAGAHKIFRGHFLDSGFAQFMKYELVLWAEAKDGLPEEAAAALTRIPENEVLLYGMMLGALAFQLFFWLSLLSRQLRILLLLGMCVFHGSIGSLAGVYFISPMAAALTVLVPSVLLEYRSRTAAVPAPLAVAPPPPAWQRAPWLQVAAGVLVALALLLGLAAVVPAGLRPSLGEAILAGFTPFALVKTHMAYVSLVVLAGSAAFLYAAYLALGLLRRRTAGT